MAIDHITELRREFPGHFKDRDLEIPDDDILRIPTLEPDPRQRSNQIEGHEEESAEDILGDDPATLLEDWLAEQEPEVLLEPMPGKWTDAFGGHPGGLTNDQVHPGSGRSTIIERLAFYLPFHAYKDWWGIYIFPEGILRIRQELASFFMQHQIVPREQVNISKRILYHHEYYHHAVESFATRLEALFGQSCYLNGFSPLYKRTFGTRHCFEETCANSYAREKTIEKSKSPSLPKDVLRSNIDNWFRGAPPGYAEANGTGTVWSKDVRTEFFESCLNACLPLLGVSPRSIGPYARSAAWLAAGHFDRGIGDVRTRICYVIPKGSPLHSRLPLDLRTCIKGRSFKQKLAQLRIARFIKQGGAHELWQPYAGGRAVPIPRHDGMDLPKGTMRAILRQLNSSMSIDEFLRA
jgi:hypothetical protein